MIKQLHFWSSIVDLYTNIFLFRKKLQCFESAFAADAAVFHSAERRSQISEQPAVYPYDAGFQHA